jgi:serine/threonine-protein kinase
MDNKLAEVRRLTKECLHEAPRATECLAHSIAASSSTGDCPAVAAGGRRWLAISPDDRWGSYYLAVGLLALGEPDEAVDEAIGKELALERSENRAASEARWVAAKAVRRGDLAAADRAAEQLAAAEGGSSFTFRADGTVLRVQLARERGDLAAAATLARGYMHRRKALSAPDLDVDPLPLMLAAERAGGFVSGEELREQMDAWKKESHAQFGAELPPLSWIVAARVVTGHDDAVLAIASRPPLESLPLETGLGHVDRATNPAIIGRVSLLAGRFEEASPLLEEAARTCFVRDDPLTSILASLDLGATREALGDKTGACTAYGNVLRPWGHAKPRSVSAEKARERAKALGCAPTP